MKCSKIDVEGDKWLAPILFLFLVFSAPVSYGAQDSSDKNLTGSLGQLPVIAESNEKGILVDFMKALQKAYPEGQIKFEVVPFKRSLQNAISGNSDFHAPILKDPTKTENDLGFAYSTDNIWDVIFALYTNKSNKNINIHNLNKYKIETDAGHVNFFNFKVEPSSCIECSLKKVDMGRIDGYIFAAMESDSIIKKNNLKNLRSVAFKTFEGKFVLPLGAKGKRADALLHLAFERTRQNGDFDRILGQIINYYKNWKPMP